MTVTHFVVSDSFGGVEGHICTLIRLMRDTDIEFKIVCHEGVEEKFRSRLADLDVEVIALKIWPRPSLKNYKRLIKTFRELSPDIVHCHLYSATRVAAMAAKIAGVKKVIETIHIEEVWREGLKKFLFCSIDGLIGRFFLDRYIAVSHAVSKYYQKNKWVPADKISVIHNTTDHQSVLFNQKKFSFNIGFLGRLVDQKGVDTLIKSIEILKDKGIRPHLYIGGTGPLMDELLELVKHLKVENSVTFLGNVSDKDSFFKKTDIFVLPSRYEGFPLVLLEAGMYQMPVVATEVSGTPEIIRDNETGFLVEKDNPEELAAALHKYRDEKTRKRLSKNLNKLVTTEFSADNYVKRMVSFYESLI